MRERRKLKKRADELRIHIFEKKKKINEYEK